MLAAPLGGGWSASLTGGAHRQSRHDLDEDGWIDIPGYERWTARPRLFWEGADGASAFVTVGAMTEDGRAAPCPAAPRRTAALSRRRRHRAARRRPGRRSPARAARHAHLRASGMTQDHRHVFGDVVEDDRHDTSSPKPRWPAARMRRPGSAALAFQRDSFRSETFPAFDYSYDVPGLFAQVEHELRPDLTLAASARLDFHSEYGTQFSPRLSALYRPGPWTIRASLGRGFYAPTPFVEEIEAAGLSRLEPLSGLEAETARRLARHRLCARADRGERHPVRLQHRQRDAAGGRSRRPRPAGQRRRRHPHPRAPSCCCATAGTPSRHRQLRLRRRDRAGRGGAGRRRGAAHAPPHRRRGGDVGTHGKGRIGVEAYYTGRSAGGQSLPHESRPYLHLGVLGEIVLGKVSLFANAENILGVRQTRYDPLLRPQRAPSGRGRWTSGRRPKASSSTRRAREAVLSTKPPQRAVDRLLAHPLLEQVQSERALAVVDIILVPTLTSGCSSSTWVRRPLR
jgi:outer membrane receptor for ferrienterochelin and colicins